MSEIIEIACALDFTESEISDLLTILTHREDVNNLLINRLRSHPDAAELLLREVLSNPRATVPSLEISLENAIETHQSSLGPYKNKRLNKAHIEAKQMGKASEFEHVIDLLGESVDPHEVLKKLQPKLTEEDFTARYGSLLNAMDSLGVSRLTRTPGYSYKLKVHSNLIDALNYAYKERWDTRSFASKNQRNSGDHQEYRQHFRSNQSVDPKPIIKPESQRSLTNDVESPPKSASEAFNELIFFALMGMALFDFVTLAMASDVHYASNGNYLPQILSAVLDPLTSNNSAVNTAFGTGFFLLWLGLAISAIGAIIGLLSGHDPLYLRIRAAGGFGRLYLTLFGAVLLFGLALTIATWS